MIDKDKIVLAIESAVCGGSLSLIRGGTEIAAWSGADNVSKAEDLLPTIDSLLTADNISRKEIGLVAVSAGPGSFTGIRIGIATALGLGRALDIPVASISVLRAMVLASPSNSRLAAAIPMGRNAVCVQTFSHSEDEIRELDEPHTIREEDFLEIVAAQSETFFVIHTALFQKIVLSTNVVNFDGCLAKAVGQLCIAEPGAGLAKPLFISKSF